MAQENLQSEEFSDDTSDMILPSEIPQFLRDRATLSRIEAEHRASLYQFPSELAEDFDKIEQILCTISLTALVSCATKFPRWRPEELARSLRKHLHDQLLKYVRGTIVHGNTSDIAAKDRSKEAHEEIIDLQNFLMCDRDGWMAPLSDEDYIHPNQE